MVAKDIKTFLNINNKGWLSIDAGYYKMWENTPQQFSQVYKRLVLKVLG